MIAVIWNKIDSITILDCQIQTDFAVLTNDRLHRARRSVVFWASHFNLHFSVWSALAMFSHLALSEGFIMQVIPSKLIHMSFWRRDFELSNNMNIMPLLYSTGHEPEGSKVCFFLLKCYGTLNWNFHSGFQPMERGFCSFLRRMSRFNIGVVWWMTMMSEASENLEFKAGRFAEKQFCDSSSSKHTHTSFRLQTKQNTTSLIIEKILNLIVVQILKRMMV